MFKILNHLCIEEMYILHSKDHIGYAYSKYHIDGEKLKDYPQDQGGKRTPSLIHFSST